MQLDFSKSIASTEGAPIPLFHGTFANFETFDMSKSKDGAHWFTPMESHAASFGPVRQYFLMLENPMIISDDDLYAAWDKAHPDGNQDDRNLLPRDFVSDYVEAAKKAGHDGLVIKDMGDRDIQSDMYLAFRPEQIHLSASITQSPGEISEVTAVYARSRC